MNVDELNRILDREFQRLTDGGKAERRTVSDMAEFFGEGISASLLYKWKSGERDISRKGARQIAAAFRKGDPVAIEQLEKELLGTTQPSSAEALRIEAWFNQHASEANLMVVEFRELPILTSPVGKHDYLMPVARAVANGLSYAIILPFGTSEGCLAKLPRGLSSYISSLEGHVMDLYTTVLFEAFEEATVDPKVSTEKVRDELLKVHGRLKLYTLVADHAPSCPAIGYRLFYVAKKDPSADDHRKAESLVGERWEWISSREGHKMISKVSSDEELEATSVRYFPIVEFWQERRRLARSASELTDFAEKLEVREAYMTKRRIARDFVKWSVFQEERSAEVVVNAYLENSGNQNKV